MSFIAIYITHPSREEADRIAGHLLQSRLIACYNCFPIESAYWWHGHMDTAGEIVTLCKTQEKHWDAICAEVKRLHPYDVPCVIRFAVEANAEYEDWVRAETV